jgi:hypothetical protein
MEPILINKDELEQSRLKDVNAEKDLKFVSAPAIISSIPPWSLAHEIGLKVGDKILEINGHKLRDIFDFEFHFKQSEEIEIVISRNKKEIVIELEKDADDELGAEFLTPLFNGVQECANDCPFCFVENQPLDKNSLAGTLNKRMYNSRFWLQPANLLAIVVATSRTLVILEWIVRRESRKIKLFEGFKLNLLTYLFNP